MSDNLAKVKELRELTGAGIQDCKTALSENNFDIEKSIEYLRKKGITKAAKKSSRDAAEGLAVIASNNSKACILEVNSETDFVAKNNEFINFCSEISKIALANNYNLETLLNAKINNSLIKDELVNLIAKIGENIKIRRIAYLENTNGIVANYIHNQQNENMGKIGVIISIDCQNKNKEVLDFSRKVCMHIAAMSPMSLGEKDLSVDFINKEKEILKEELKNQGKKDDMIDKILVGKLKKVISDNTLMGQKWIHNQDISVEQAVNDFGKEIKQNLIIKSFIKYKVGEGIEVKKTDLSSYGKELSTVRTGRANPKMLDGVRVEVYGQKMPISQLATVSIPEPQMINVQVWDKANVSAVDQAIRTSDLNLNPLVDGQLLRIAIPKLTEERRKELIKVLKTIAEKAKVAIRNIRRDSLEELKKEQKDKNLSEDDLKKNSNEIQKITDLKIAEIDKKLSEKEVEILKV
ncbi:MAG: translation elongation factor Ts [Candidatus Fonsibacter ubiquis]|nr:translation elongation factor Ts [Candidatus Fonsibacter ubiquis]